jgi:hypothetical protein
MISNAIGISLKKAFILSQLHLEVRSDSQGQTGS